MMKSTILCGAALLCLAACSKPAEPNAANFAQALNHYLDKRGDLCLDKTAWPIDVTAEEAALGATRNAVQMPVLERLGIVAGRDVEADGKPVRRYALTDAGRRWYLPRAPRPDAPFGKDKPGSDLCAARLSLDRVLGWEKSARPDGGQTMVVSYTYKVDPAPWAASAEARRVFPMVDRVIRGAGAMPLQEALVPGANGWVAKDL